MELARVVGQVVATVKQPGLRSMKLLLVVPVPPDSPPDSPADPRVGSGADRQELDNHYVDTHYVDNHYVAVDYAGAGTGEVVLVARGSAARVDAETSHIPTDAAVVAIVDSIVLDARTTFRKSG
jgi:ethanolamine utilization protein EutN